MSDARKRRFARLIGVLGRLSPLALALVGIGVFTVVSAAGYYGYRTYDYVQHDNDFCMSCHLMSEPFERFAQSAHQGLGCKACHRPNLLERSQMGLTAVVEDPEEISVHANVPNETCAECHIEGDPSKWRLIANSAGHRVHLESEELTGLQCVECHATSIHEFAPIDRTCSQSECHADNQIQLGAMSDLTIHCAACHSFVAPSAAAPGILGDEVQSAIRPDFDECLSCHAMRQLVELPDPDPHAGGCAACHNPHEQTEPSQAGASCASAGCHVDAHELTSFHRGLEEEVAADCLYCHRAHDFSLDAADCAGCHEESGVQAAPGPEFDHGRHETIACSGCHTGGDTHGATSVQAPDDCLSCHHTEPVSTPCADCHATDELPSAPTELTRSVAFSVGTEDAARRMTFPHEAHVGESCESCHTESIRLTPPDDLDCRSCHEDHHTPESQCAACHVAAPVSAHPPSEAHVTCAGAGCHTEYPFDELPRTRAFCLGCHQDLTDHEPERRCEDCHQLPPPRAPLGPRP